MSLVARNGGEDICPPFETRIVGEAKLVPLLNQGFDILRELSDARVVRRPLDDEEAVSKSESRSERTPHRPFLTRSEFD